MSNPSENIIGKGTWIDKIAYTIIEREKKLGRTTDVINVESGLGASGIPHIGSMGDAVRAYGISLALRDMGYNSDLIAFSDDFDGLRKVPYGLPNWLEEFICKPVSTIPDPFGDCHGSYGQHMSSLLLEGLDAASINYKFKSGTQTYKSGILSNQIHKILSHSKQIGDKIAESTGQHKYIKILPFFPICEQCNRLYVASSIDYLSDERAVTYSCTGNTIGKKQIKGCGHTGQIRIDSGNGKLAWKVEFAARWQAFEIKFEAFGKDIMDSVKINDWISDEILKFNHPLHAKYEMFLDKGGKKISKSAGNVLTPQMWLRYGTPKSLLLLLYKRISGTRHVGLDDIPVLMDEYDLYEDIYFGKIKEANSIKLIKLKGIYEYINNLDTSVSTNNKTISIHIPYRILIQQATLFKNESNESELVVKIFERLKKYGLVNEDDIRNNDLLKKVSLSVNWVRDFKDIPENDSEKSETDPIEITLNQKQALHEIRLELADLAIRIDGYNTKETSDLLREDGKSHGPKEDLAEKIQTIIYNNAKIYNIQPRDLFKLLYKLLINAERGPKLGNYIIELGINNVTSILERKVK